MSRELKFRIWLAEPRAMSPPFELWQMIDTFTNQRLGHPKDSENTVVMQYTGLKDNTPWEKATDEQRSGYTKETWNGVEIYEGDIVVKTDRWHGGVEPFTGEIVYDAYAAAFGIRSGTPRHNTTFSVDETRDCYEVIGNVYQNPELLQNR